MFAFLSLLRVMHAAFPPQLNCSSLSIMVHWLILRENHSAFGRGRKGKKGGVKEVQLHYVIIRQRFTDKRKMPSRIVSTESLVAILICE